MYGEKTGEICPPLFFFTKLLNHKRKIINNTAANTITVFFHLEQLSAAAAVTKFSLFTLGC